MSQSSFSYRRYSREAAIHALHIAETSHVPIGIAIEQTFEFFESEDYTDEVLADDVDLSEVKALFEGFARLLAEGTWKERRDIDVGIDHCTPGYDVDRLAQIDRNVLRVAAWELHNIPYIPPAVTINEAVEIAKKYSTAESGRFVNGVLSTMLQRTEKTSWDPSKAPADPDLPAVREALKRTKKTVVAVETVEEGSDEAKTVQRYGIWQVKSDEG